MSSTRLLVLGVIRLFQPVHGYDVRRELLSWRVDQWANVAPGSIYNALKSMERDGLLNVVGTKQVGGRPERTTYALTAEGETEFQNLLRETLWTVQTPTDPLMPGLAFMMAVNPNELKAALEHRINQIRGLLKASEFAVAQIPSETVPRHVRELYRLSAARLEAEIPWAQALLAQLEAGEYDPRAHQFADETSTPGTGEAHVEPRSARGHTALPPRRAKKPTSAT